MRASYYRHRVAPVHFNRSVRRTHDLVRAALNARRPELRLGEDEMMSALSASRATVRSALRMLAEEGVVTRGPKIGTTAIGAFVFPIDKLLSVADQAASFHIESRVVETVVVPAPAILQKRLDLDPTFFVAIIEVVFVQGATPLALATSYLALTADEVTMVGEANDPIAVLEGTLRVSLGETETTIGGWACDEETATLLDIAQQSPILWCEDVIRDTNGRARALSHFRFRGDRVVFSATAHRPSVA